MSKSIELKVTGMSCSHCENRVVSEVTKIDGVKKVKANAKKGIVSVKGDVDISTDAVKEAIVSAGYGVD